MKPWLSTIDAYISFIGLGRYGGSDAVNVIVDGVQLSAHLAAVVSEPHRPHGVGFFRALEALVPLRQYQSWYEWSQFMLTTGRDAGVPVLEADPDVGTRSEAPRTDQRVEESGTNSGWRGCESTAIACADESLALQGEAGHVAAVGVKAACGTQPAVGERGDVEVVFEEESCLAGGSIARSPCRHPLAVDADM